MFSIGRVNQIEVLRARRQELEDENRLIEAEEEYEVALDDFKVFLGVDTGTPLEILPNDPPFVEVDWDVESAVEVAFQNRLDYVTRKDQLEDSARGLRISADALRSDLDLSAGYTLASDAEGRFGDQTLDESAWSAGITWRPPLDRVNEKNSYRTAQIQHQRAVRDLEQFEDTMIIGIRSDFRQIERIRKSVGIQRQLIEDQQKNLRKAQIEFDQGTVSNREVVDAQQSLVGASNDLISEQVNYEIARLRLLQDLGILFVDENGVWMEP
jgi:outer membrane protein TolC